MTLRRRLVASMIILVALGLAAMDLITLNSLPLLSVRPNR